MSTHHLRKELDSLNQAIASLSATDSNSARLNRSSIERLRQRVAFQIAESSPELDLSFQDELHRNEMPSRRLAIILDSLGEMVAHTVNRKRPRPYPGKLPDSFRALVDFRLVAIQPGSVKLHLRAPQPAIGSEAAIMGRNFEETEVAIRTSIEQILDVIEFSDSRDELDNRVAGSLHQIGPDAARSLAKLTKVIAEDKYSVNFRWQPDPHIEERRTITLGPSAAARLRSAINRQEKGVEYYVVVGRLATASRIRNMFDLIPDSVGRPDGGGRISGQVARDIQPELRDFFDRRVRAYLRETTYVTVATGHVVQKIVLYRLEHIDQD